MPTPHIWYSTCFCSIYPFGYISPCFYHLHCLTYHFKHPHIFLAHITYIATWYDPYCFYTAHVHFSCIILLLLGLIPNLSWQISLPYQAFLSLLTMRLPFYNTIFLLLLILIPVLMILPALVTVAPSGLFLPETSTLCNCRHTTPSLTRWPDFVAFVINFSILSDLPSISHHQVIFLFPFHFRNHTESQPPSKAKFLPCHNPLHPLVQCTSFIALTQVWFSKQHRIPSPSKPSCIHGF